MLLEELKKNPRFPIILENLRNGIDITDEDKELMMSLNHEEINKLFIELDAFSKDSTYGDSTHLVVLSIVNIREKYLRQFALFTMNAFLHQAVNDYSVFEDFGKMSNEINPELTKLKQNIILEFLKRVFYNPESAMTIYYPSSFDQTRELLPNKAPESLQQKNTVDVATLTKCPEIIDFIPSMVPNPAPIKIDKLYVPVPSRDFYFKWASYENTNYDSLKKSFCDLTNIKDGFNQLIRIFDFFPNNAEGIAAAKSLQSTKSTNLGLTVDIAKMDKWVVMESTRQNKDITKYGGLDQIMNDILQTAAEDTKYAETMLKTRVKTKQKHTAIVNTKMGINPDVDGLDYYTKKYLNNPINELSEEMKQEVTNYEKLVKEKKIDPRLLYENVDEHGVPLNATALRIISFSDKEVKEKEIYIESKKDNDNNE